MLFTAVTDMHARHISFNLDSIADMGKFPRFCVNTYRWADHFFNPYDSVYVKGTGKKFNIKLATESWTDYYHLDFPEKEYITMVSDPCTSLGAYLTYMAVSAGYDINVSKIFGGPEQARKRFNFGFNCSLFAAELSFVSNDVGTRIKRFGNKEHPMHLSLPFSGINTSSWSIDTYYFFNHKKYSQAAVFNLSKIQRRSQGSFYAGFSYYRDKYNFDFSELPDYMKIHLPEDLINYRYSVASDNYAFRLGYGYNWVLGKHWVVGVSESPIIGLKKGFINRETENFSCSLFNRFRAGAVYNHGSLFLGLIAKADVGLVYDAETTMASAIVNFTASVGYRFNLW